MNEKVEGKLFDLGNIYLTSEVSRWVGRSNRFAVFVERCLERHAQGDWGNLCEEDKSLNDSSLNDGSRIFSAYEAGRIPKIWIITEADRCTTTVLFPTEY